MTGYLRFPNINNITISGRLAREVDAKYTGNNQTIARICIAVSHFYKDESGEFKEQASFIDCVAFGETAKKCLKDLKKGSPVMFEGYLKTRTYEDAAGQKRKLTEIVVNKAYPLERSQEGYEGYPANQGYPTGQNNPSKSSGQANYEADNFPVNESNFDVQTSDDVPF